MVTISNKGSTTKKKRPLVEKTPSGKEVVFTEEGYLERDPVKAADERAKAKVTEQSKEIEKPEVFNGRLPVIGYATKEVSGFHF